MVSCVHTLPSRRVSVEQSQKVWSDIWNILKSWLSQASVCNSLNCVHNCDDHSLLKSQYGIPLVQIKSSSRCVHHSRRLMVLHLYSAFSIWIYYVLQHFVGDFARLLYGAVHNLFNVRRRIHWSPQNKMNDVKTQNTWNFTPYSLRIVYRFFNVPQLF